MSKNQGGKAKEVKKESKLGIETTREQSFPDWYTQAITRSEMIDYYPISGCYVLRPWSYRIWEFIQQHLDGRFKTLNVQNCYFPMFVTKDALNKESTHIADFSPEVAWVTKSGNTPLEEEIAIRPTSETVMYPSYSKWIRSYRDLPLRLNQWCNVVRWEFKNPTPFLRTREFLWQEGHTAHADKAAADTEVRQILDFYKEVYEDLLAVPVIQGIKTEKEKFAGGDYTTTVEAFIPGPGRAIQGATSHGLGQNFAKMFDITYQDPADPEKKKMVWQNSWGCTTRTIGVMVMVHGDNKGLVLPPRIAPLQVVIIPAGVKADNQVKLFDKCLDLEKVLKDAGIRTEADVRDQYTSGWKFNYWELKGVPARVEIGPRDMEAGTCVVVRRDTGVKATVQIADLINTIKDLLVTIHKDMLAKAVRERDSRLSKLAGTAQFQEFMTELNKGNMVLSAFCNTIACEEDIKAESAKDYPVDANLKLSGAAKSLCMPFAQDSVEGCVCVRCGKPAQKWCLFGRSY